MNSSRISACVFAATLAIASWPALAQPRSQPQPQRTAKQAAPIDLTGQWVAIVTEDWRFRMVTPPQGDFAGFQLTPAGQAIASNWDPAKDEAEGDPCKSYGAAAIMRVPGRLRVTWADDETLQIQTDAGQQTRLLHFKPAPEPTNGSLKVVTTHLKDGYLRKNGVPYSAATVLTEYFDLLPEPDGSQWLVVKSIVDDPAYHRAAPITSSNFRKQTDRSGWDPAACSAR